jgi:hypothetical protein
VNKEKVRVVKEQSVGNITNFMYMLTSFPEVVVDKAAADIELVNKFRNAWDQEIGGGSILKPLINHVQEMNNHTHQFSYRKAEDIETPVRTELLEMQKHEGLQWRLFIIPDLEISQHSTYANFADIWLLTTVDLNSEEVIFDFD